MPSAGSREQSGAAVRPWAVANRRGSLGHFTELWEQHVPRDRAEDIVRGDDSDASNRDPGERRRRGAGRRGLSYQDNGDGTITDLNTGLMWEKKSQDGSDHDVTKTFPWSDPLLATIWDWIDAINTEVGNGIG